MVRGNFLPVRGIYGGVKFKVKNYANQAADPYVSD